MGRRPATKNSVTSASVYGATNPLAIASEYVVASSTLALTHSGRFVSFWPAATQRATTAPTYISGVTGILRRKPSYTATIAISVIATTAKLNLTKLAYAAQPASASTRGDGRLRSRSSVNENVASRMEKPSQ